MNGYLFPFQNRPLFPSQSYGAIPAETNTRKLMEQQQLRDYMSMAPVREFATEAQTYGAEMAAGMAPRASDYFRPSFESERLRTFQEEQQQRDIAGMERDIASQNLRSQMSLQPQRQALEKFQLEQSLQEAPMRSQISGQTLGNISKAASFGSRLLGGLGFSGGPQPQRTAIPTYSPSGRQVGETYSYGQGTMGAMLGMGGQQPQIVENQPPWWSSATTPSFPSSSQRSPYATVKRRPL